MHTVLHLYIYRYLLAIILTVGKDSLRKKFLQDIHGVVSLTSSHAGNRNNNEWDEIMYPDPKTNPNPRIAKT